MKRLLLALLISVWIIQPSFASETKHIKHSTKQVAGKKKNHKTRTKKSHTAKRHGKKVLRRHANKKSSHKRIAIPNVRPNVVVENKIVEAKPAFGFMDSMKKQVVGYVHKTVSNLRYSVYKMGGTKFDVSKGIYVLDCSDYVDNILEEVYPNAFSSLVNETGSDKPTTEHYYDFFNALGEESNQYWSKVDNVDKLEAGDVLVFRYKNSYGAIRGGHVMVVMDKPTQDGDGYLVRVADSAPSGHSEDTRRGRVSGIGIGTLVLKANPQTGEPLAYAWKVGADWKSNVKIAMARPVGN